MATECGLKAPVDRQTSGIFFACGHATGRNGRAGAIGKYAGRPIYEPVIADSSAPERMIAHSLLLRKARRRKECILFGA